MSAWVIVDPVVHLGAWYVHPDEPDKIREWNLGTPPSIQVVTNTWERGRWREERLDGRAFQIVHPQTGVVGEVLVYAMNPLLADRAAASVATFADWPCTQHEDCRQSTRLGLACARGRG